LELEEKRNLYAALMERKAVTDMLQGQGGGWTGIETTGMKGVATRRGKDNKGGVRYLFVRLGTLEKLKTVS